MAMHAYNYRQNNVVKLILDMARLIKHMVHVMETSTGTIVETIDDCVMLLFGNKSKEYDLHTCKCCSTSYYSLTSMSLCHNFPDSTDMV